MAKKIFCDGCDRQLGDGIKHNTVVMALAVNGETATAARECDLCNGCLATFKSNIDPKRWVRCAPDRAA